MLSSAVIAKVSADPSLIDHCFDSGLFLSGGVILSEVCVIFFIERQVPSLASTRCQPSPPRERLLGKF